MNQTEMRNMLLENKRSDKKQMTKNLAKLF